MKNIIITIAFTISMLATAAQSTDCRQSANKFGNILYLIESQYVDTTNVSTLTEEAIVAMLKKLDPHSSYIPKKDVAKMNESLQGSFEGIGASFQIIRDTIVITEPIMDGPAEKMGLQRGDKIISIDGENSCGKFVNTDFVTSHLRGKKGTAVNVEIVRNGIEKPFNIRIVRDKIPIKSVNVYFMLDKKTGYIKLDRFAKDSYNEVVEALRELQKEGCRSLVFDLRSNGGGLLNVAVDICSIFLPKYSNVVYTQGVHNRKTFIRTDREPVFPDGELIVLIDEHSASASEIVSGTMQDWDRGTIVGRRSFGKGLVQKPYDLADGSQIRLTISRYYTPSGRCIQKPYDKGTDYYLEDGKRRAENGEYFHADSIHFADSLKYETLVKHRIVYGGGGIMPDIFIPADTSQSSKLYIELAKKLIFSNFSIDYIEKHKDYLNKKFSKYDTFNKKFQVNDDVISEFKAYAEKDGVQWNDEQFEHSRQIIENRVKALIARALFGTSAYYKTVLQEDDVLNKVENEIL